MLSAFGGRIGVEEVTEGRLKAAGSMSGMAGETPRRLSAREGYVWPEAGKLVQLLAH